jgi:predicted PolB exonuclease-like 3'-5' exonuclease
MNVLVFDIETVPDVEAGRRFYDLDGLSDVDVASAMFHLRRQENGTEFLRHHMHRVVAISAVLRRADTLKVWSLGEAESPEKELIQRFFDGIDRFSPTLVSWNGSGFDLPVLHYRALVHGVAAPRYWETGEEDQSFRWNNYLSRFHYRLGLPGKMGMSGAKVWDSFAAGDLAGIRNYCETDVLNTYLVYLRFELMRGRLTAEGYAGECQRVRETLAREDKPHFREFLERWES